MATQILEHAQPRLAALRRRYDATAGRLRTSIDAARPTTGWRVLTSVVYSGVIAVVIVGAAVLLLGVKPSNPEVTNVNAVEVGDCVSVADGTANRAGCEGGGMTFSVAEKVAAKTACSLPSYARVESDGATLCVVPNLTLGSCYQVRPDQAATTDIRPIACPTALGGGAANVVRVTERASGGPLNCRGSAALNYPAPQRVSYCITPAS
ncbi:hypothetical protein [Tsukamurella strandjordii]|uniref:Uncharacterized protein n=1 Tax=Tsukamurella strandjordii TaxID=147577 RepID=A0AA90NK33_9ACTN|nr:hypothetical protein [Tsukamurella strandjordii]MDP0399956.1 hypothetical protein [Tsukamurella strandjordii]